MRPVTFLGNSEVTFQSQNLGSLRDCNNLLHDNSGLHSQMEEDGYLLIRGLINRETIIKARETILRYASENGDLPFKPGNELVDAVYNPDGQPARTMGEKAITHHPDVLEVLEGTELFNFFRGFFGQTSRTFDYKWLRMIPPGRAAGPHFDVVYMGRGSQRLHTCWIPFGDVPVEKGTLAILVGSHNLPSFNTIRQTYGQTDVDRDRTPGHFGTDPLEISKQFGGVWKTTDFEAGDVIIFTMYTLHTSTRNMSDQWRISCDIRFQPETDSVDNRWVGENPEAHSIQDQSKKPINFDEAREIWGV